MKAKIYIGIISAILLPGFITKAQIADARNYRDNEAGLVINNYYDHDYYYSSRINRFHRSYATFSYYSPVFTDAYWYDYQPYSWGISIYGGSGFGFGLSYNYPLYYDYGWDYPYYGGSYYGGYDPFCYNWFSPLVINIGIGNWWPHNYYSWHDRDRWDYNYNSFHNNRYNSYNDYNNYNYHNNYNNRSSDNYRAYPNNFRRGGNVSATTTSGNINRREVNNTNLSRTDYDRNKTNNGLHLGDTRRNTNPSNPGGTSTNTRSRGNNNNVNPGNSSNANINPARNNSTQYRSNSYNSRSNPVNNQVIRSQVKDIVRPNMARTPNINYNANSPAGRSQTLTAPVRRNSGIGGHSSGSVRSGNTNTRSSSPAIRSGSGSSRSSGTTRSKSDKSSSSSKGRRR